MYTLTRNKIPAVFAGVRTSFGALDFEEAMLRRATPFEFAPGIVLPACSAEDLFIMKVFAARPRDWIDAEGIVVRQKGRLNRRYIMQYLPGLCELKETPEIVEKALQLLETRQWRP